MTDLNACRHPRNEVINPAAPGRIFPISPLQARSEKRITHSQSLLQVIRNSKKVANRPDWMAPLRDVAATRYRPPLPFGQIADGCSETSLTHRGDGSNSGGRPCIPKG
jgi:hypothetical protein